MRSLLLGLCLLSLTACATRLGDFTALSTKNINVPGERGQRIKGEELQRTVFIFPVDGTPTMKGAIDDALEKGDCDLLVDAVLYQKSQGFPFLYLEAGFMVEGTCIKTRAN